MPPENGTLTKWNDEKGFGFISPDSGGKQVFLHINAFSKEYKRPVQGLPVVFERKTDAQGRYYAAGAYPQNGHKKVSIAARQVFFSIIVSILFFAIVGLLVTLNKLPIILLGAYGLLSLLAFAMYKKDKSAAEWDEWRTPESTLHLISLVGGWPGALLAQNTLRHKSSKVSFRVVYWITVLLNCGILVWFLTPKGAKALEVLMHNIHLG